MPFGQTPGPSVKNPAAYEALKALGKSKSSAAAISNTAIKRRMQKHPPKRKHTKAQAKAISNRFEAAYEKIHGKKKG